METVSERRRRKLISLAEQRGGVAAVARAAGLSPAALDQVVKGTLLPAKADGTRNAKSLGDPSARAIERALDLAYGWFDADDSSVRENADGLPEPDEVTKALQVLAHVLSGADKATRSTVAFSFSLLAAEPDQLENVIAAIKKLLSDGMLARTSQDDGSTDLITDLDTSRFGHGKSNRVQGGRR